MSNLLNLKKCFQHRNIWLSNKIFPTSMCPLVQPTCSHYFSNFYPLFDPKPNYIIQNTMIYHRFPLKIFFVLFLSKKKNSAAVKMPNTLKSILWMTSLQLI